MSDFIAVLFADRSLTLMPNERPFACTRCMNASVRNGCAAMKPNVTRLNATAHGDEVGQMRKHARERARSSETRPECSHVFSSLFEPVGRRRSCAWGEAFHRGPRVGYAV